MTASQFEWHPEKAPTGPVSIILSTSNQEAYVYRDGIEIGRSAVPTGVLGKGFGSYVYSALDKLDSTGRREWMSTASFGSARALDIRQLSEHVTIPPEFLENVLRPLAGDHAYRDRRTGRRPNTQRTWLQRFDYRLVNCTRRSTADDRGGTPTINASALGRPIALHSSRDREPSAILRETQRQKASSSCPFVPVKTKQCSNFRCEKHSASMRVLNGFSKWKFPFIFGSGCTACGCAFDIMRRSRYFRPRLNRSGHTEVHQWLG